jgi:hypothetical protein
MVEGLEIRIALPREMPLIRVARPDPVFEETQGIAVP